MVALVYFPHAPWPPRTGAHRRCLQILAGLARLGYTVHLASTARWTDTPWTPAAVAGLRSRGVAAVWIYRPFRGQSRLENWLKRWRRPPRRGSYHDCSPPMRRWFDRLARRLRPDVVYLNYAFADPLVSPRQRAAAKCVIEMHDLLSVNRELNEGYDRRLESFARTGEPGDLFDLDPAWASALGPAPDEVAVYDRYDGVVAISRREKEMLERLLRHARVEWLPMHIPPLPLDNRYAQPPLFTASANSFNQLGLSLLAQRLMPRLLEQCPDFQCDVAGDLGTARQLGRGLRYLGYVPDLAEVCRQAAFFICPVFAGTGRQVKILEAMAHGLAVVAFAGAAAESPVVHGENGLIARTETEFIVHCLALWRDRESCRRLGNAARAALPPTDDFASVWQRLLPVP